MACHRFLTPASSFYFNNLRATTAQCPNFVDRFFCKSKPNFFRHASVFIKDFRPSISEYDISENKAHKSYVPHPEVGHSLYHEVWKRSLESPEEFWAEQAEKLVWYKKWDRVLDMSLQPFTKW